MVRVTKMRWMAPLFFLEALLAPGCGPDLGSSRMTVTRDTLPSGVLRVRGPENGSWTEHTKWSLTELYRVGAVEGEGPEVFGQVWDVEIDDTGRLYVLDRLEKEVRVCDDSGSFGLAFGREGEGPGEFENPFGLAWDSAGSLWVVDVRLARYSAFDAQGRHLREYRRSVGGYSWPWPGRFGSDGRLYERSYARGADHLLAFVPGEELTAVDSFPLVLPESEGAWNLQDERGFGAIVGIPYSGQPAWVLDHEAMLWVGKSDIYSLAHRRLEGDTLMVIERQIGPVAVSPEERATAIEGLEAHLSHPKMDLSRIPSTKPFFRRLIPDDSGDLWVLREGEGRRWFFDVFERNGVFLGPVNVPVVPGLFPPPLIRGDRMIVVTKDELDIQSVVVYRINRPAQ